MSINELTKEGIKNIPVYIPGRTAEKVKSKYNLDKVLKLASNENQYGASAKAEQAMMEEIKKSYIYPDPFCMEIRKKISAKFGFDESGDNVVISSGANDILFLLGEVFINEGDEVVLCDPTFGAYHGACRRNNGKLRSFPLTPDLKFDLKAMAEAINEKTKLVFICNPNNPTGTAVDSSELRTFIKNLPNHVIAVVDEAYIEYATDPAVESMVGEIREGTNLIVVRTFSKIYGMAGHRLGYALMNKELHSVLQKSTLVFVAGRIALAGAMAAMDDDDFIEEVRQNNRLGREYLSRELTEMGWKVYPSHTNFIYADSGYNSPELAKELEKKGLIIRGNFQCSRITIGTMEQNKEVIRIIKETLAEGNLS